MLINNTEYQKTKILTFKTDYFILNNLFEFSIRKHKYTVILNQIIWFELCFKD